MYFLFVFKRLHQDLKILEELVSKYSFFEAVHYSQKCFSRILYYSHNIHLLKNRCTDTKAHTDVIVGHLVFVQESVLFFLLSTLIFCYSHLLLFVHAIVCILKCSDSQIVIHRGTLLR